MHDDTKGSLEGLRKCFQTFVPDPGKEHDIFAVASIEEAMIAAKEGNLGVGAVIIDVNGQIISRGHNRTFYPYFRSDIHAEMDVMTRFEERLKHVTNMRDYTLVSSLEPCPMCMTRLITSGIGKVFYVAADADAGMANKIRTLGPAWNQLAQKQVFSKADCSQEISDLAFQFFLVTIDEYLKKLMDRR